MSEVVLPLIPLGVGLGGLATGWLLSGDKSEVTVEPGATYAAAPEAAGGSTILGLPSWVVLVGGAVAVYMFMKR